MRDIKFRALDLDAKDKMYSWDEIKNNLFEHIKHDRIAVMQYTGLKDKNGKEIYEGDLLSTFTQDDTKCILEIKFLNGAFIAYPTYYVVHRSPDDWSTCEIIGNIYQNPELLK